METIVYVISILSTLVIIITFFNKKTSDIARNKSIIDKNSDDIKSIQDLIKENEEKNALAHKDIESDMVSTKLNLVKVQGTIENISEKIDLVLNYLQKEKD